jgi:hypothetical protein
MAWIYPFFGYWLDLPPEPPERPQPCQGKRRGVTQSPKRAKRRNRRKP